MSQRNAPKAARGIAAFILLFPFCGASDRARGEETSSMNEPRIDRVWEIARVPSDFPVGFCLLTDGDRQYVAYYDADHRMTVAARDRSESEWTRAVLPSKVGWDSHNYVTLAVDADGFIHLSGNMHAAPLVYFRTARPGDITSFERIDRMTGEAEGRCTYPVFLEGADGSLLFHYRDGGSGNGREIYNRYDCASRTWRRFLDTPLTDGRGRMNAYMIGPERGPDGWFHMSWVWRDTPACETNHDLSYARSRDLLRWETAGGNPISLPITIDTPGVIVDPVPVNGGILNGTGRPGFDHDRRVVIAYHKFDDAGKTQAWVARFEDGGWKRRQVSDWDYRWEFRGGGAIGRDVVLGAVRPWGKDDLSLEYRHVKHGRGAWILDGKTLRPIRTVPAPLRYPRGLMDPESDFPGMEVRFADDLGDSGEPGIRYFLRWETLPPNRDRRREGPTPDPSLLRLCRVRTPEAQ